MTVAGLTAVAACRLAQGELTGNDARFSVLDADTWAGAEASLIGAAGGLALAGKIPLVNLSSSGALIRACEQVRLDLCYHRANAKLFDAFAVGYVPLPFVDIFGKVGVARSTARFKISGM